jgi:uncharacterized membrane protein
MVGLGFLPGDEYSYAVGVSADGGVIGGYGYDYGASGQPFLWTASGGSQGLGLPSGSRGASATALSVDGTALVGQDYRTTGARRGYRWTAAAGFVGLGEPPPGGLSVNPGCVSGDGSLIGGWYGMPAEDDPDAEWVIPFLWDAQHGVRDLKQVLINDYGLTTVTDWGLSLEGISADGLALAGTAYFQDESGQWVSEAYLIRLPEPDSLLMLAALVLGIHQRLKLRRR